MSDQHDQPTDDRHGDTEGHLYIPKDERAGAGGDTEGHGRWRPHAEDVADAEGHGRFRHIADAGEGEPVDDVEGHGSGVPGDPINEPSAVRGDDGRGRR